MSRNIADIVHNKSPLLKSPTSVVTDRQLTLASEGNTLDEVVATTFDHPASTTFPRLLQAMRVERGWSKADLAKRAKFDPSTITRLEQGSRNPDRDTVQQLAGAMALTAADRDRLLAASGYRSDTWDDPDLVQIATLLADASVPTHVRHEIRTMLRMAISHGRLARVGVQLG